MSLVEFFNPTITDLVILPPYLGGPRKEDAKALQNKFEAFYESMPVVPQVRFLVELPKEAA